MRKGWYKIAGVQDGDRTLEQQIKGLEHIDFTRKTVLELGCAEGLMSRWMIERGASLVYGYDIVDGHIEEARRQCAGLACWFKQLDLNQRRIWTGYDIVMALAIFHKLKRPDLAAANLAISAKEMVVVRLPPATAPIVIDPRSDNLPFDVEAPILRHGFERECVTEGTFGEWTATYRRRV